MAEKFDKQKMESDGTRIISSGREFSLKRFFLQWEWLLFGMLILVNLFNVIASPNYGNIRIIFNATRDFLDKAIVVFPMSLVLMLGEIDISVASIMALSATLMGVSYSAGIPMIYALLIGLLAGALCGFINGFILIKFPELSSMIVTLSTQIIFRGIAQIILETNSVGGFPPWFISIASGKIGGIIPYTLVFVIIEALFFAYLLHGTKFGRSMVAMGNSETVAYFSGIKTKKVKLIVFTLVGFLSAVASVYLASKMSSVRPDIARGYELDIIAMAVFGGISSSGGKGRILGAALSILVIGYLRFGLGLVNTTSQIIMIIVGALLILAVAIPNFKEGFTNLNKFIKRKD